MPKLRKNKSKILLRSITINNLLVTNLPNVQENRYENRVETVQPSKQIRMTTYPIAYLKNCINKYANTSILVVNEKLIKDLIESKMMD